MNNDADSKLLNNAEYQISLKIVLKDKAGKILILKATTESQLAGFYDLPGGRIKENERTGSFRIILERELKEELGEDIKFNLVERPVAIGRHDYWSKKYDKTQHVFWVLFEAEYLAGEIKISSEHSGYKWATLHLANLQEYFIKGPLESMTHYFSQKLP